MPPNAKPPSRLKVTCPWCKRAVVSARMNLHQKTGACTRARQRIEHEQAYKTQPLHEIDLTSYEDNEEVAKLLKDCGYPVELLSPSIHGAARFHTTPEGMRLVEFVGSLNWAFARDAFLAFLLTRARAEPKFEAAFLMLTRLHKTPNPIDFFKFAGFDPITRTHIENPEQRDKPEVVLNPFDDEEA
jgi:hypothetical protein